MTLIIIYSASFFFYIFSIWKQGTHVCLTVTYVAQQGGEKVIEQVGLTYLSILCSLCDISKSLVVPVIKSVVVFQFPAHPHF
jgi:hypothetical protein